MRLVSPRAAALLGLLALLWPCQTLSDFGARQGQSRMLVARGVVSVAPAPVGRADSSKFFDPMLLSVFMKYYPLCTTRGMSGTVLAVNYAKQILMGLLATFHSYSDSEGSRYSPRSLFRGSSSGWLSLLS